MTPSVSSRLLTQDGPGAVASARTLGARAHAVVLAERGWVHAFEGLPLVLRKIEVPEASEPTARVVACDERLLAPQRWQALAEAVLAGTGASRLHLRSTLDPDVLEPLGLRVFQHFVAKEATASPTPGVELRAAATREEWDYVGELMCDSLRAGMPDVEFTAEQLDTFVHGYLRLGRPDGAQAHVAWVDGERVGTAVWRRDDDELTGEPHTRLVDIMFREQGRGISGRIASAFQDLVAGSGTLPHLVVGTVVGEPGGAERVVVGRLTSAGWRLAHTWWTPVTG